MAHKKQAAESADQVIDALGGTGATARLAKVSLQAVSNWRAENRLPPRTFLTLTKKLEEAGYTAPPELWGMVDHAEAQQ